MCLCDEYGGGSAFTTSRGKKDVQDSKASCARSGHHPQDENIKGPFMLIKGEDALYPQYDFKSGLQVNGEWKPWLKEEAIKNWLRHQRFILYVIAHWNS